MVASEQHLYQTIVLPRKLATGSIHDFFPLVGILFEILRIGLTTLATLTHMLNDNEICRNVRNHPIFNIQDFKYWWCTSPFWTVMVNFFLTMQHML